MTANFPHHSTNANLFSVFRSVIVDVIHRQEYGVGLPATHTFASISIKDFSSAFGKISSLLNFTPGSASFSQIRHTGFAPWSVSSRLRRSVEIFHGFNLAALSANMFTSRGLRLSWMNSFSLRFPMLLIVPISTALAAIRSLTVYSKIVYFLERFAFWTPASSRRTNWPRKRAFRVFGLSLIHGVIITCHSILSKK